MDDFVAKPNTPNAYGLTGGEYNAIAPEKKNAEFYDSYYYY